MLRLPSTPFRIRASGILSPPASPGSEKQMKRMRFSFKTFKLSPPYPERNWVTYLRLHTQLLQFHPSGNDERRQVMEKSPKYENTEHLNDFSLLTFIRNEHSQKLIPVNQWADVIKAARGNFLKGESKELLSFAFVATMQPNASCCLCMLIDQVQLQPSHLVYAKASCLLFVKMWQLSSFCCFFGDLPIFPGLELLWKAVLQRTCNFEAGTGSFLDAAQHTFLPFFLLSCHCVALNTGSLRNRHFSSNFCKLWITGLLLNTNLFKDSLSRFTRVYWNRVTQLVKKIGKDNHSYTVLCSVWLLCHCW